MFLGQDWAGRAQGDELRGGDEENLLKEWNKTFLVKRKLITVKFLETETEFLEYFLVCVGLISSATLTPSGSVPSFRGDRIQPDVFEEENNGEEGSLPMVAALPDSPPLLRPTTEPLTPLWPSYLQRRLNPLNESPGVIRSPPPARLP